MENQFSTLKWNGLNSLSVSIRLPIWPTFSASRSRRFRCRPAREDALQLAGHFDARKNVHPEWILTGKGPCLMTLPPEPSRYETDVEVTTRKADEEALRRLPSHMLAEELVRRIAVSQGHAFLFGVPRQPALAHCPLSNPMPQQKKTGSPPPAFSP